MDILTQGLLGGVLAQSVAKVEEKKLATFIGIFAGLLADADILIRSANDPLLNIEYHRHFTHSLFFIPVGAAIALMLLWPFIKSRISTGRLYLFCLAGYSMSGVLDASTSYGTHLFWPLSDERVAFNIISIIDPVFTLILLFSLLLGLRIKSKRLAYIGLLLCSVYLVLGFIQLQRAQFLAQELIHKRGHVSVKHVVKPTLANLVLWRSVYRFDNRIYVDAVRVGFFGESKIYEGESVKVMATQQDLPGLDPATVLYADIQRFTRFSDGFIAFDPSQKNVLGDIRYSMLPVSAKPLWGIVINAEHPQEHADYRFFRDNSNEIRQTFINMVLGRCATAQCK
jgi:inner membrane protein